MKKALAASALALCALVGTAPASAQATPTSAEISAFARVAMPGAFRGLQNRCRTSLAGDAYMYANGRAVSARLLDASQGQWPQARGLIMQMTRRQNPQMASLLAALPPETVGPMLDEMVAGMVNTRVQTTDCERIDHVLELLDPLPAENLAELVAVMVLETQDENGIAGQLLNGN